MTYTLIESGDYKTIFTTVVYNHDTKQMKIEDVFKKTSETEDSDDDYHWVCKGRLVSHELGLELDEAYESLDFP